MPAATNTNLRLLPRCLLLAALPAWLTLSVLISSTVPPLLKLTVGSVFLASLTSPMHGLIAVAVLTPLGRLLAILMGQEIFRLSEALVVAFLAAWALRADDAGPGPRLPAALGWLLAVTIVASIATQLWLLARYPGEVSRALTILLRDYYTAGGRPALIEGARVLESLALVAATFMCFRRHPALAMSLPAGLGVSATAAAIASILLWQGVAPASVLAEHAKIGYRVSAHVADVNAAGSYFALILCAALGMAARSRGIGRAGWLAATIACAIGLWFAESRAAIGTTAMVLIFALVWFVSAEWTPRVRTAVLSAVLVLGFVAGMARTRELERDPSYRGRGFRQQFNIASLRMIAARPRFGVGIGQYYDTSPLFLSPQLAWTYGHENAHNYFLQLTAELGLLGFGMFAAWFGGNLATIGRALIRTPRDQRLLGAAGGIAALIGTSLTGHPLLINEVAFPFWMLFGLTVALGTSTLTNPAPSAGARNRSGKPLARAVPVFLGLAVIATAVMSAIAGPIEPARSPAVTGFYGWETDGEGRRFRWTTGYASLFVPTNVKEILVPVRLPMAPPAIAGIGVDVAVAGIEQSRTIALERWSNIDVLLPKAPLTVRFTRVDLKVDRTWRPALYVPGSADDRPVGVQIGEWEIVR